MKKLFPLMFVLTAVGFSGCKKESAPPQAPVTEQQAPAAPAAQDPNAVNPAEAEGAVPAAPQGK